MPAIRFPFSVFEPTFRIGQIYHFTSNKLKNPSRHYFVLAGICPQRKDFIFQLCTKQFQKNVDYVERNGLDTRTIVPIPPHENHEMPHEDTCINCNGPIHHTLVELESMYNSIGISHEGEVTLHQIQQIFDGSHMSDLVDGWMKDIVPTTIDNLPPPV